MRTETTISELSEKFLFLYVYKTFRYKKTFKVYAH